MALLDHSRSRRAGLRDLVGRFLEDWGDPTWMTGTYDPELDLLYWCAGNPAPDFDGKDRLGDNLYSNSVLALDPDDGKLRWHYQFTPHDVHDWDANEVPVLLDREFQGKKRKLLVQANRNGFYYVLDRETGEFLLGKPFARMTWASGIGSDGRPQVLPDTDPTEEGNYQCPGVGGATNWMAPAYNPDTGLLNVTIREECTTYYTSEQEFQEGHFFTGSTFQVPDEDTWGGGQGPGPDLRRDPLGVQILCSLLGRDPFDRRRTPVHRGYAGLFHGP